MNPLVLFLASGEALYPGAVLLLVTMIASPRLKNRWVLRLRNLAAWSALAMMTFAGPPLSVWLMGVFFAAFVAWFVAWNLAPAADGTPKWRRNLRPVSAAALAILTTLVAALELPHRWIRLPAAGPFDRIAVIGDSLSAGIETEAGGPWPKEFETLTGLRVHNLSQAGAQVADGPDLARRLSPEDRLVLVELGGNDLIANVSAAEFERGLEATLTAVRTYPPGAPPRTVLMFELPLLPHKVAYGRIQRRLAARHGVTLLPRRHLTEVLGAADATSDGLHLAPAGARGMARLVADKLAPLLKRN